MALKTEGDRMAGAGKGSKKPDKLNETGKFRVLVGSEWQLDVLEIEGQGRMPERILQDLKALEQTKLQWREGVGRLNLSYTILAALLIALLVATAWGWTHDDFSGVVKVWSIGAVPLGWVAGHFFKAHG